MVIAGLPAVEGRTPSSCVLEVVLQSRTAWNALHIDDRVDQMCEAIGWTIPPMIGDYMVTPSRGINEMDRR